jgi:hypothetical protein
MADGQATRAPAESGRHSGRDSGGLVDLAGPSDRAGQKKSKKRKDRGRDNLSERDRLVKAALETVQRDVRDQELSTAELLEMVRALKKRSRDGRDAGSSSGEGGSSDGMEGRKHRQRGEKRKRRHAKKHKKYRRHEHEDRY